VLDATLAQLGGSLLGLVRPSKTALTLLVRLWLTRDCHCTLTRDAPPVRSPELLRAEVRRLHRTISTTVDPMHRRHVAERAFELAQQAELIANLPSDVEGLWRSIARYDKMLAGTEDQGKQRVLAELLQDAEDKLQQISSAERLPR
jgi:hypothetical protein